MATQEIVKKPAQSEALTSPTPADLLRIALDQNADVDKLAKLMELQERWEKNEARKAFVSAMNAFKSNPPKISKNKDVKFGQTAYSHATLDHVCDVVTKSLGEHGISHRWKVEQIENVIRVTCILTHDMGHSEETTLQGTADNSGSKNSIQAIGSTVTYLQRYTLLAATGLAAGNDDDGLGAGIEGLGEYIQLIQNSETQQQMDEMFNQSFRKAKDAKDGQSMLKLVTARDERKKKGFNAAH